MNQVDPVDDLALTLMAQNNMLLALIRSHPNRDILATSFSQAQRQFPEAATLSAQFPEKFKFARSTIVSFETALTKPLDP
jgi:hypothetical protein